MTNDADDLLKGLPRIVIFRGKRARIIGYEDGRFRILAAGDQTFRVRRDQLIFPKPKKTS